MLCLRAGIALASTLSYLVEVEPSKYDAFATLMLNLPFGQLGKVKADPKLVIRDEDGRKVIDADIDILKQDWQKTFDW